MASLPEPTQTPTTPIGVIFFPFQVHDLLEIHIRLIDEVCSKHDTVIIALPVRRIVPSKTSPLTFVQRELMIRIQSSNNLTFVAVPDNKYPADQVKALETAVQAPFSAFKAATLYASPEFIKLYEENGGQYRTFPVEDILDAEADSRALAYRSLPDTVDSEFRRGIIVGLNSQFPINWIAVDIAIKREREGQTQYLLVKKPNEKGWRLPGGFKDRRDSSLEMTAIREPAEEIFDDTATVVSALLSEPRYIGSRNIKDWRYRDEIDGIMTALFEVDFLGDDESLKLGDDLVGGEMQWWDLNELPFDMVEGEHIHLLAMLSRKRER